MDTPYYTFMCKHLSIRERELRLIQDEYAFLQSCGGVSSDDMAQFRASVLSRTRSVQQAIVIKDEPSDYAAPSAIVIKDEPRDDVPSVVSLKSMLLEIITHEQAENINKICRHIRPLLERDGIRTFLRNHSTHVRSADQQRVAAVMQKEGMV